MAIGANLRTGHLQRDHQSPTGTADTWALGDRDRKLGNRLNQVVCSTTTTCVAMGDGTERLRTALGLPSVDLRRHQLEPGPLPTADYIHYFGDIDCTSGASGTCAAVGATPNGAVILTSVNGPAGNWSDTTPTGSIPVNSTGTITNGIPIEINNNDLVSPYTDA